MVVCFGSSLEGAVELLREGGISGFYLLAGLSRDLLQRPFEEGPRLLVLGLQGGGPVRVLVRQQVVGGACDRVQALRDHHRFVQTRDLALCYLALERPGLDDGVDPDHGREDHDEERDAEEEVELRSDPDPAAW